MSDGITFMQTDSNGNLVAQSIRAPTAVGPIALANLPADPQTTRSLVALPTHLYSLLSTSFVLQTF